MCIKLTGIVQICVPSAHQVFEPQFVFTLYVLLCYNLTKSTSHLYSYLFLDNSNLRLRNDYGFNNECYNTLYVEAYGAALLYEPLINCTPLLIFSISYTCFYPIYFSWARTEMRSTVNRRSLSTQRLKHLPHANVNIQEALQPPVKLFSGNTIFQCTN